MARGRRSTDRVPDTNSATRVLELLTEALELIDDLGQFPAIGARLQSILDDLKTSGFGQPLATRAANFRANQTNIF